MVFKIFMFYGSILNRLFWDILYRVIFHFYFFLHKNLPTTFALVTQEKLVDEQPTL
jgi:hypothetical protein